MLARHALLYGAGAGAGFAIWILVEYAISSRGDHLGFVQYASLISFVFPVAAISVGIMRWRDRRLGGHVRFAQAFSCALAIGLVFALSVGLFLWLYAGVLNTDFVPTLIEQQGKLMAQSGASPEEIDAAVEAAKASATAGTYAFAVFSKMLTSALLIALFASIIVRRRS